MSEIREENAPQLGEFLGKQGTYFLKSGNQEREVYSSATIPSLSAERTSWVRNRRRVIGRISKTRET